MRILTSYRTSIKILWLYHWGSLAEWLDSILKEFLYIHDFYRTFDRVNPRVITEVIPGEVFGEIPDEFMKRLTRDRISFRLYEKS